MKRKIPARKHHGIRDPIKQREQRLLKIKDKINDPPEIHDNQKISCKLAEFIKLKEQTKKGKQFKFKRNINNEDFPKKNARPTKKVGSIRQLPNEDDSEYLKRINRATTQSIKEAEYEKKYGVEIIKNPKTGEISIHKKSMDQLNLTSKNRKRKEKNSIDGKVKQFHKEVIKEFIKEENEMKAKEKPEFQRDIVKFGEVVHAPPTLSHLPRKAKKSETVPRPGAKSLLLKSLFVSNQDAKTSKESDLKGKRKDLPTATRRMLEDQQSKAVEMYRKLKKNINSKI